MGARIGVVGLGNMGIPMALRIATASTVIGYDRDPAARERAVGSGLAVVDTLAEVGASCDVVILLLPNSDIVEQVVMNEGLAEAMPSGSTIVDMSSSDPSRTRQLAARLHQIGRRLVDAPVSGGVKGARAGMLTIMAGGDESALDTVESVLETMGTVVRTGAIGSGHAIKALNNMLSAISMLATGVAMDFGRRFGLDPQVMLQVFNTSSGRSFSTEYKWPTFVLPETFDSGFSARLLAKDLRIATALGELVGEPTRLGDRSLIEWDAAVEQLGDQADHTEIARYVEGRG